MSDARSWQRSWLRWSVWRWSGWLVYAGLLIASWVWQHGHPVAPREATDSVALPAMTDRGSTDHRMPIAYRSWLTGRSWNGRPTRPLPGTDWDTPIVLIHGSPGAADDFNRLGPALKRLNRDVIALDLPGFGASDPDPPSLSIRAHARAVISLMDWLGFSRAHVVGWSLGGGVALNIADLAPDRVASITLMASVADQSTEGSGSYYFEHLKYAVGYAGSTALRYLTPHFGVFRGVDVMRASTRNFWDSDMRPLASIMRALTAPTLILHGRHDFLSPDHAAERAHELIPGSTLVMLDASHFMPFLQPDEAAEHIARFVARAEIDRAAGLTPTRQHANLAPRPVPVLGAPGRALADAFHGLHWLLQFLLLAWAIRKWGRLWMSVAALLVSFGIVDIGVTLAAMLAAQAWVFASACRAGARRQREVIAGEGIHARPIAAWRSRVRTHPMWLAFVSRLTPGHQEAIAAIVGQTRPGLPALVFLLLGAALAWCLWALWFVLASLLLAAVLLHPTIARAGVLGFALTLPVVVAVPRVVPLLLTRLGRQHLGRAFRRARHHEFWPSWTMYWPMAPIYTYLGLRYGPIVFTAANPGISGGGGVVGESKDAILRALAAPECAPSALVPADHDPARRAALAADLVAAHADLGGYPLIVKPDSGHRGFALKLVRAPQDFVGYFQNMRNPAILQRFAPGPHECGILWARNPDAPRDGPGHGARATLPLAGFIFSITRKQFPILIGDGERTLESLILRHPRFSLQASVFLERLAARREEVLAVGERLRLGEAGNHCQGTLFLDGADLITPALERRIDEIASGFRGPRGEPLDIGRFDVRYTTDEALREGGGFTIVELNGNTGESTNIYDPRSRTTWAIATQARQWELMYRLGAAREAEGHMPLKVLDLFARLFRHYRTRTGNALAD
ncbi:MAG: alpha/beta fold hydrolase [Phycisphaerales bacterium]